MDAFDQLELLAEISATLLGFIAVFLAFSGKDGRFAASDRHFVQALVITSSLCLVMGLIPRALFALMKDNAWNVSLTVAAVGGFLVMGVMAWTQLRMDPEESAKVHILWHVPSWGMGITASVLIIWGLADVGRAIALYVNAATLLVFVSVWCFVAVVFRRFF